MKGDVASRSTPQADAQARHVLSSDVKQRAENLMIVDLMRNDIGRISVIGSVHVTDLFTVETYRTLHQMTSGVRAMLLEGSRYMNSGAPSSAAGSVIGAPKIRAQELIAEYETEPRGVYCGAIGSISPTGRRCSMSRSAPPIIFRDGSGEMGIGSGVSMTAVGAKEYDECLLKMKFLTDPPKTFELIETLLWERDKGFGWPSGISKGSRRRPLFSFKFDEQRREPLLNGRPPPRDEIMHDCESGCC